MITETTVVAGEHSYLDCIPALLGFINLRIIQPVPCSISVCHLVSLLTAAHGKSRRLTLRMMFGFDDLIPSRTGTPRYYKPLTQRIWGA